MSKAIRLAALCSMHKRLSERVEKIEEQMKQETAPLIKSIMETCSLRQIARRTKRSPTHISHLKNGNSSVSAAMFASLVEMYRREQEINK